MRTIERSVAYFSMEIALREGVPTYSGGLGMLAGDTIRSAADLSVPMVAVSLLHRKGYLDQRLAEDGWQSEEPVEWMVEDYMEEVSVRTTVSLEGRTVHIRAWRFDVAGIRGFQVPVYLLDSDLPENGEWDRSLTDTLYGGDRHYRLCQEVVLGMGGVKILRALGYDSIERFHMNEGHASLLTLQLLIEEAEGASRKEIIPADVDAVREKCVFTTHTPVPAGHDQFPMEMVRSVLGDLASAQEIKHAFCIDDVRSLLREREGQFDPRHVLEAQGDFNMTFLALNLSRYVNGVAKKHGEVSRLMFADYAIDEITNGVHARTWVSAPFQALFDRYIPAWKGDNFSLRYALTIPKQEFWSAHLEAKSELIRHVNRTADAGMAPDRLTIGFARRAATYKRADLLFSDIERLKRIAAEAGAFQVVYAGKAHPQDHEGKEVIKRIARARDALRGHVEVVYLENYDMRLGKLITAGVDLWLNTPQPPNEASGTSGMKAALNGVPSLSTLDGWWIEGHIEGITGWAIDGKGGGDESHDFSRDAEYLYDKLERVVIPLFYSDHDRFIDIMRSCVALNGSFFNTQRMLLQYVTRAYFGLWEGTRKGDPVEG
jgi:starch phosphorylase